MSFLKRFEVWLLLILAAGAGAFVLLQSGAQTKTGHW